MILSALSESLAIFKGIQSSVNTELYTYLSDSLLYGETSANLLEISQQGGIIEHDTSHVWYFYFMMVLFISYALARTFLGRLSSSTLNATLRYSAAASMFNDNSQLQGQRDFVLYAYYFLSMGFFSMILMQKFHLLPFGLEEFRLFLFNTVLLIFVFYSRIILVNLVGYIFNNLRLFREYLYQGFSFNKFIGIAFLPLNFVIIFTYGMLQNIAIYLSISILLIIIGFKIIRGINFSIKNKVFNFYLFLYLCALEIVPMLLLYKWFIIIIV